MIVRENQKRKNQELRECKKMGKAVRAFLLTAMMLANFYVNMHFVMAASITDDGWLTEPGQEVEDEPEESDIPINTLQDMNGEKYYFDKNGDIVTNMLKKVDGKYYYFDSKGRAVTEKWKTIHGKKYYFKKSGAAAIKSYRIKGQYYVFNCKGQLLVSEKNHRKKLGDDYFYVNLLGQPVTGWHVKNRKSMYQADVFYVFQNGKCARNREVKGIRFNQKGYAANSEQALARLAAKKFVNRYTNVTDSREMKLKKCAMRIIAYFSYVSDRYCKDFHKEDWVYRAAIEAFATESGDCYYVASCIGTIADALGFEDVSVIHLSKSHAYVRIGEKGHYIYYDNMGPVYGGNSPRFPNAEVKRIFHFYTRELNDLPTDYR